MNNNNTTYKDSPLGKIPSDWEVNTLGVLTEKIGSGITPRGGEKVYKLTGRPFLRSQNVGWGTLILDDVVFIDEETHKSFPSTEIKDGDVFLNITGASIGRSAVSIKSVIGGNVNQHVCIIRSDRNLLNPSYLNSFLLSKQGQNLIYSYQAGGNRQGLNFEQIRSFRLPLPPLPEQKAIAHILGLMDVVINKNNQLIAKKELQKKWLMQNLLTYKKRLKGFGGEWKEHKISQLGQIVTGNTPSMARPEYYGDKYCWATAFDFKGVYIDKTEIKLSEKGKNVARIVPKGSILVTCIASIGKNAIANIEMAFNQQINAIVPNENFHSEFIYYIIENSLHKLIEVAGAGAVSIINKSNFEAIKLKFPSIKEQTAIAKVLHAADKEIQLLKTKTEKLRDQKKGLMQVLLTGKKRLKVATIK